MLEKNLVTRAHTHVKGLGSCGSEEAGRFIVSSFYVGGEGAGY